MPRPKHDWDGVVRKWLLAKQVEPNLSHDEFFRREGLTLPLARKRIGSKLTQAWDKVRAEAGSKVEQEAALNLSKELLTLFRTNRGVMAQGAKALFGDGTATDPGMKPKTYRDAVGAVRAGTAGVMDVVAVLTGGQPVLPPGGTGIEEVIRWNEPTKPEAKGRKPSKRAPAGG